MYLYICVFKKWNELFNQLSSFHAFFAFCCYWGFFWKQKKMWSGMTINKVIYRMILVGTQLLLAWREKQHKFQGSKEFSCRSNCSSFFNIGTASHVHIWAYAFASLSLGVWIIASDGGVNNSDPHVPLNVA